MTKQELFNTAIEAKEEGDGKKIIAFYESMGFVDNTNLSGNAHSNLGGKFYYGVHERTILATGIRSLAKDLDILDFSIIEEEQEKRMNIIAQNGNDGEHYEQELSRKDVPVFSGVLKYFPDALKEVAKASFAGQQQHNPDKPLAWDRSKSGEEYDSLTRHLIDSTVEDYDTDGVLHLAKVAWRALAGLQKHLETNKQ
tara:strand:- start:22876 stop:23466 length:591 start_codon:yes stop_codon:yes gene_type:complete